MGHIHQLSGDNAFIRPLSTESDAGQITRTKMHLSEVSIDVLNQITSYLHFLDVANLWFTGQRSIHYKLAYGGVSRIYLPVNPDIRRFVWPSLIASLPCIAQFRISEIQASVTPLFQTEYLDTLPQKLRVLELRCSGALHALNELLSRNPVAFPCLNALTVSIFQVGPKKEDLELRWPRSLTSITLEGHCNPLPNLTLANLPSTLVSLEGNFNTILDVHIGFPSRLMSLKIRLAHFINFLPALPADLAVLSYEVQRLLNRSRIPSRPLEQHDPETFWTENGIASLPKGLKVLQLPITNYTPDMLRQLPPYLTELIHRRTHGVMEGIQFWPPHLEKPWRLLPSQITKSIASELPSSIQKLEEVEVAADALPHLSSKTLIHVQLVGCGSSLAQELEKLGLAKMKLNLESISIPLAINFPFSALPSNLTSLAVQHGPLTSNAISSLPATLQNLYIRTGPLSNSFDDWGLLPRNLALLSIDTCGSLSTESASLLPRSLTSLHLEKCQDIPEQWFGGLPQALRNLELGAKSFSRYDGKLMLPQMLGNLSISFPRPPTDPHAFLKLFFSLPPSLSSLRISLLSNAGIDVADHDLSLLPRRLRRLQLPPSPQLTVRCLRFLPASLESVSIGHLYSLSQFNSEAIKNCE